jgi:HK97 gp10 family phage protein
MENVTVKIIGLDKLQDALEDLGKKGTNVVRAAVREGAKVVKDEVVLQAPKDSGILAEHVNVRTKKQRGTDLAVSAFIGPSSKPVIYPREKGKTKGIPRTAEFVSKLLEFGSATRAKKPYITRAWEASKNTALQRMISVIKGKLGL